MTALVAVLAFVAGGLLGAAIAVWWLNRRPVADPSLDSAPAAQPAGEPVVAAASDDDAELKPILDATRGVLSDLEERYRGRRSGKADG
jgi:hypothetical protein